MSTLFDTAPEVPAVITAAGLRPLKVVGLDLSMSASGVCLADGTTVTIKTQPKEGDRRLQFIVDRITVAVEGDDCDLVVIEEAPPGLKGPAIKAIHMVHGAVRLRLIDLSLPYVTVNPTTLKGYATGSTSADKTAMAMAAFKRTGREFTDSDQCDAFWLRAAGLDHYGQPEFTLPQTQRDRLAKVVWPDREAVTPR